jgi:hypothetical protein
VGEGEDAGDVAHRPYPLGGATAMVDEHLAVLAQLDAEVLEPEPPRARIAPDGHEQLGGRYPRAIVQPHSPQPVVAALHAHGGRPRAYVDAVLGEGLRGKLAHARILPAQQRVCGLGQCDRGAEAAQGLSQLDAHRPPRVL